MPDFVWIQNVIFPLVGMGMGVLTLFGLYRIVNRLIDRKDRGKLAAPDGAIMQELERLRGKVESLEGTSLHLEELEERLDFAERMLTERRQSALPGDG